MKNITISRQKFIECASKEIENARGYYRGCRIPIYAEEDGTLYAGEVLSENSYKAGRIEIYAIKSWSTSDIADDVVSIGDIVLDRNIEDFEENGVQEFNYLYLNQYKIVLTD